MKIHSTSELTYVVLGNWFSISVARDVGRVRKVGGEVMTG